MMTEPRQAGRNNLFCFDLAVMKEQLRQQMFSVRVITLTIYNTVLLCNQI